MNNIYEQSGNKRLKKRVLENNGLNGFHADMSDVNFEIGKTSYTAKVFLMIVAFAVIFGGRIFLRQYVGGSESVTKLSNIVFWIFVMLIFVLAIVLSVWQSRRPSIFISGRKLFCGGNCWSCDEITKVSISKWFEVVSVYAKGKKVLSFAWELDNSELFIAWAKKCRIKLDDKRMKNYG